MTSFEALRRRPARLTALILCIGLAGTAACYWLRYHDLVRTHASLMSRMASDAQAQLAQGKWETAIVTLEAGAPPSRKFREPPFGHVGFAWGAETPF